jgi:S-(hydroxymethyl)glutathione dehydrogenase/alcohol dehydrogenase
VRPGATVAVIGAGGVGTATILGAQVAGAARIIAVDPVAMKRESALRFGATEVVDPSDGDPVEQVKTITDGRGVDYAFEAVGSHALEMQALQMTRRGGPRFIGVPGFECAAAAEHAADHGRPHDQGQPLRIGVTRLPVHRTDESGRLDVEPMITRHYPEDVNAAPRHARRRGRPRRPRPELTLTARRESDVDLRARAPEPPST